MRRRPRTFPVPHDHQPLFRIVPAVVSCTKSPSLVSPDPLGPLHILDTVRRRLTTSRTFLLAFPERYFLSFGRSSPPSVDWVWRI